MKSISYRNSTVDIAEDIYTGYASTSASKFQTANKLRSFSEIDYQSVASIMAMEGYALPSSMRMLEAHGNAKNGRYLYSDVLAGERIWNPVDEWIKQHEAHFDVLYICVCNKGRITLPPAKSFLIYPNREIQGKEVYLQSLGIHEKVFQIVPPLV